MTSRRTLNPTSRRTRGRGERGMSLVEALIAMALLLLVAIGILPLFTRAMVNNAAGSEATAVANHARHRLEELGQLPFNNLAMTIEDGNERLTADVYYSGDFNAQGDETWAQAGSGSGAQLRDRVSRVRQFELVDPPGAVDSDLDGVVDGFGGFGDEDRDGEFDDPLGPVDPAAVDLKEISVELVSPRQGGPLGTSPRYRVRNLRAF